MPKADPAQQPSGHRADNRPQLTAHRKQRKPLGAAAFPVGLAVGTGPRQQGLDRRGKQSAADAGQAGAEDNGPQRRSARQQQITGDANDAAGEDDGLSAIAVGQRPADDKHALLREGAQPEDQADKSPREQHVVAQEEGEERNDRVKANIKNELASQ